MMRRGVEATVVLVLAGCATPGQDLDAQARWESAERRRLSVMRSLEAVHRLHDDYAAVSVLARDGDLRARSYYRLATIDSALGHYEAARENLEKALLSGPLPETQCLVLLDLGDVLARRLGKTAQAARAYEQIISEHPGRAEAELARLRLEVMRRAR